MGFVASVFTHVPYMDYFTQSRLLWTPPQRSARQTAVEKFRRDINRKHGLKLGMCSILSILKCIIEHHHQQTMPTCTSTPSRTICSGWTWRSTCASSSRFLLIQYDLLPANCLIGHSLSYRLVSSNRVGSLKSLCGSQVPGSTMQKTSFAGGTTASPS